MPKPNFTGTWKLNVLRSGPILPHGLTGLVIVIDHRRPSRFRISHEKMTGNTGVAAIFGQDPPSMIDGKEHTTRVRPGKTVKMTAQWSGPVLVTHEVTTVDGTEFVSDTRTSLSDDSQVLTISEHYREPGLDRIRDWVFDRQ